ncbi:MAG: corrinoid activation/regeneration protein AcsV [Lachnospiraceae bacterium]|nr:corrinoid activation/regeneration protein AcsV [Lachnospiraceae bacterium]MDD3796198.1 corrinoid activation/regeneration protein AcsV [Lachnospiraceae bacterium]
MFKVTFQLEGGESIEAFAAEGENLLEVARKTNVAIDAPCSGNAACGKCRVKLIKGEIDSKKTSHISDEEYEQGWRLACVSKVDADVEIMVPDIASAYKSRMKVADLDSAKEIEIFEKTKADIEAAGIEFKNDLEVVRVTMEVPSLDDTMPDNERLTWAVEAACGMEHVKIPFAVLKTMAETLRKYNFDVQCVIRKGGDKAEVLDICGPEEQVKLCGLAIDIGTTSVAALLIDMKKGKILAKASTGNGQIRFGADVINRIIESLKPDGKEKLQDAIVSETINPLIKQMCRSAKISPQKIYRMCVAGNTTMNHLLVGADADPVRMEPYIPTFYETTSIHAHDLGINIFPHARVIMAPNIGSYVGGDITAGTLASCIWNRPEMSLFIDLGTNGELVFGNEEFMMSCACSAGPAFEGGDISCGMRATDGAIEACTIDKDTMIPTLSVIGDEGQKAVGLCGSGIIDMISELFRCGIIDPKGKFIREGDRVRHDKYGMGSYVIVFKEDAASVKDVEINEVDIDNFMRAKGAIFSAIRVMLNSLDFTVDMIDDVYVAGGIGSGINMQNAVNIGMFPDISRDRFHYIGNSSLSGAYALLLSNEAEAKVHDVAHNMTYLELSNEPTYMDEFVASCFLPHTDAGLFPSLTFK